MLLHGPNLDPSLIAARGFTIDVHLAHEQLPFPSVAILNSNAVGLEVRCVLEPRRTESDELSFSPFVATSQ